MSQSGNSHNKFSAGARIKSFVYAFAGIRSFLKTQHNAWIHLVSTIIVIVSGFVFHVSATEAIALTIVVGLVWVAELFNTAIEKIMDFISVERDPKIKLIKDVSAAAVLVSAVIALITGLIIFIPKL